MTTATNRDSTAFQRELPHLISNPANRGRFALINNEQVIELFDTFEEGVQAGYDRFGLLPFLVLEVNDRPEPIYFSRNLQPCQS